MKEYSVWLLNRGKIERTVINYVHTAKSFVNWFEKYEGHPFNPQRIMGDHFIRWGDYLQASDEGNGDKKGVSVASVRTYMSALRTYFRYLAETGEAPFIRMPVIANGVQSNEPDIYFLSDAEQQRLIRFFEGHRPPNVWKFLRNRALIYTFLYAGFSRSECVLFKNEDISFENDLLTIRKGKSRQVPLDSRLKTALLDWMNERAANKSPFVFISQRQAQLTENGVWNVCVALREKCNIPNLSPQLLRGTYAKQLVTSGHSSKQISALLGITTEGYIDQLYGEERD